MLKRLPMTLREHLSKFCIGRPKTNLVIAFILLILFTPFVGDIVLDFSARTWFRSNDPNITLLNSFERKFGNDESIILVIDSNESFFTPAKMRLLSEITDSMWQVQDVIRVESLTNYNLSFSEGDDISTEEFLAFDEIDNPHFLKKRTIVFDKHRVLPGVFLSKDHKSAVVYGRIVQKEESSLNPDAIFDDVKAIGEKYLAPLGIDYHILGAPALNVTFKRTSFIDLKTINPILVLLVIIYLILCFKNFWGVFLPLAIIGTTLIFMTGLIGFLKIKMNSLTFILPGIIIAIAIADSVHLLSTYFHLYKEEEGILPALKGAMKKNIWPIFLTSISTAVGFFSLTTSDVRPVSEMGLLAGIATLMAFLFSILIIPSSIVFFKVSPSLKQGQRRTINHSLARSYINFLDRYHLLVMIIFVTLSTLFGYLAYQNEVNSNPYEYFESSNPISVGNQFTLNTFGGVGGPELVLDSGRDNGITDPKFLDKVDKLQNWLNQQTYINRVISVVDIIKEVNQSLHGGLPENYVLPNSKEMIAQELFLYTMGLPQGMDLNNRMDLKQRSLRLSLLWSVQNSKESLDRVEQIEAKAIDLGLVISTTGKPILFQMMNSYVVETFLKSMGIALFVITFILIVVFRSLKIGLLSLIPNFIPIVLGAGLLTIIKTPVDIGCAIVASVTLGIAVDDTIHFLAHYNSLIRDGIERKEALIEVISGTGMALVVTTMILVSGFGLFIFASLTPNINFGILSSFVLFMALVCDLVVLPALILTARSLVAKKNRV
jgi:predicted RND superfamily exporter protein